MTWGNVRILNVSWNDLLPNHNVKVGWTVIFCLLRCFVTWQLRADVKDYMTFLFVWMLVFSGSVSPSCHSGLNYSERQQNVLFLPFSRVLQLLHVISLLWICKWKQEGGVIVQWCILGLWWLSKLVVMDLPCTAYSLKCLFVRKPPQLSPAYTEKWWELWKGTTTLIQWCTFLRMSLYGSVVFKLFLMYARSKKLSASGQGYVIQPSSLCSWLIKYWYL